MKKFLDETYIRGDERFFLEEQFDDKVYCIYIENKMASCSFCLPNTGKYAGTYVMQVDTLKKFRKRGYGKAVASAVTKSICDRHGFALWVSQVENEASVSIATSLGYIRIGETLTIKK